MRLSGKRAIVTGGARGIGLACARRFVEEGAAVVIGDVLAEDGARAAAELGAIGSAAFFPCDVTSDAQVETFVAEACRFLGGIDVLFNNAGIIGPGTAGLDVDEAEMRRIMEVNVFGTFRVAQRVARVMVTQGTGGSIINTGSIESVLAKPDQLAYGTSKHAVLGMTKAMALALAPNGIRVNAVGPGSITTAVLAVVLKDEAVRRRVLSRTPLGYLGAPEDVAGPVLFLASDESDYVTGQIIHPDGGRLGLNHVVPVAAPVH
jgi:glucose 1-dehydrogenase